jgi:protein TonB
VRLPRWVATLPLSLALHVGLVVAGLAFLRMESAPTALILDLDAIIAGGADGTGAGNPSPAGGDAAPSATLRPAAPAAPRSAPPSPSVVAASPVRPPDPSVVPRAQDPIPAASTVPAMPDRSERTEQSPAPERAESTGQSRAPERAESTGQSRAPERAHGSGQSGGPERAGEAREPASSIIAALPPGTGSGGGAGSEYAAYLARIRQRIQESLRYPPVARRRGVTGTVQLEIAIGADGAIAGVSVIASSSHEILDRAAVDAARSLPRVPFPADLRPRPLTIRLPIVFELQ